MGVVWIPAMAALAEESLRPLGEPLALDGSFGFTSTKSKPEKIAADIADRRRAASGIACAKSGVCLIAFDEGTTARLVRLTRDAYAPIGGPIALPAQGDEVDAEGVAVDAEHYYVVGSHASKRKSGDPNPASRVLARFKSTADGGAAAPGDTAKLWDVISVTEFAPFMEKPLGTLPLEKNTTKIGERGFDIEGIAVDDKRLYFGLRGPSGQTGANILSVDKMIFTAGPLAADPKTVTIDVGPNRAIRDMQRVEGGFLLLAGPDDDARDDNLATWPTWRLLLWDGNSKTGVSQGEFDLSEVKLRTLEGCADASVEGKRATKLEGFAVVDDRADGWSIVTVSDGMCDGGPMWFDVKRRP